MGSSKTQFRPKLKPFDHFDLMTDFDTSRHLQEEEAKRAAARQKKAAFRAGLDGQLAEQRAVREREAQERRQVRAEVLAGAESFRQDQAAELQRQQQRREDMLRSAQEAKEKSARRRQKQDENRRRETEEVARAVDLDEQLKVDAVLHQLGERELRCTAFRENLDASCAEREKRRLAEQAADRTMIAERQRVIDARDAQAAAAVAARQEKVDRVNNALGKGLVERQAREERELEERLARDLQEYDRKTFEALQLQQAERERKIRDVTETNVRLMKERAGRPDPEKDADRRQAEYWRKTEEEGAAKDRERAAQRRRLREAMDTSLLETMQTTGSVHLSEFGLTAQKRERELTYHRDRLVRIESEGFRPELTATFKLEAAQAALAS